MAPIPAAHGILSSGIERSRSFQTAQYRIAFGAHQDVFPPFPITHTFPIKQSPWVTSSWTIGQLYEQAKQRTEQHLLTMSEEETPTSNEKAGETSPEVVESGAVQDEDVPPELEEGSETFVSAVLGDMSDDPAEDDPKDVVEVPDKPQESSSEEVSPADNETEPPVEEVGNDESIPPEDDNNAANEEETAVVSTTQVIDAKVGDKNAVLEKVTTEDVSCSDAAETTPPPVTDDSNDEKTAAAEPTKRGLVGRLGKMLSDRRLNVGSDAKANKTDNDCESVDEEGIIDGNTEAPENDKSEADATTEATEPPKRGLMGRLGKMLSDRRLNAASDGAKSIQSDNDCESVKEEIIDGEEDEGDDNGKPSDDGATDPSEAQKRGLLGHIGKILSNRKLNIDERENDAEETKENPDDGEDANTGHIEGETMEERAMKRRGLLKRIGSYVEEKELLKRLSNRNLMRSLSKDKLPDGSTKTGNSALIDECILAVENDGALEGEGDSQDGIVDGKTPTNGVFLRIGKIIADRKSNTGTATSDSDVADDVASDEVGGDGDETNVTGARRGFLKGLRDIVSSRSLDKPKAQAETDEELFDEMVTGGPAVESHEGQSSNIVRRGRGLVARINSFIARDPTLEEEDDPVDDGERLQALATCTAALDELMKNGATCPAEDITSSLALVETELKKDLPEQRHEYLLTLQCYLLKQQALQVNVVSESPEISEDKEGALAA